MTMKMKTIYNSLFENSLRIMLLLDAFQMPQNLDRIYVVDFMVLYGKSLHVSEVNINGENPYYFSEFASRRDLIRSTLKSLVMEGFVLPTKDARGVLYCLTDGGKVCCRALESEYAVEYLKTAKQLISDLSERDETDLIAEINRAATLEGWNIDNE